MVESAVSPLSSLALGLQEGKVIHKEQIKMKHTSEEKRFFIRFKFKMLRKVQI
jgi:hypothetical protein